MSNQETLLTAIDGLDVELKKLRRRNRLMMLAIGLIVLLVVGLGIEANAVRLSNQRLKENSRSDQVERDAQVLVNCKLQNAANRVVRDGFGAYNDVLAGLVTSPGGQAAVAKLRESVAPADKTDRDCNGDGGLDGADYPT